MDVVPDPETEKLVQAELQTGRFQDATTMIGAALKHFLIAPEFGEEYTREEIEAKIARGFSQLEQGEGLDGNEFFEKLRLRGEGLRRDR